MKTVYLACTTLECLIMDIQKLFPGYTGETEHSTDAGAVHLIGDIATGYDEEGNATGWIGKQHANLYVADDCTISFETEIEAPASPVNRLAL